MGQARLPAGLGCRFQALSLFIALICLAAPSSTDAGQSPVAAAQDQDSSVQPAPQPDFLFGRPGGWVGIRAGRLDARAASDWYDFVSGQLTLEPGDFNAPNLSVDVGATLTSRADLVFGAAFTGATAASEYREFVDNNRLPITQATRLRTTSITASLKVALTASGRQIGRLAWVPSRVVPYVGAGGGAVWYRLQQSGDFVDFVDLSVFDASFQSQGWTPSGHAFGGVDVRLLRRMRLGVDGRYQWAAGTLGSTWVGFDPIDLSGFALTAGVNLVF